MSFVKPTECKSGKVKYATENEAIAWLASSRRFAAGMNAYHCGPCKAWHVGHPPAHKGRRRPHHGGGAKRRP